jgi:type IV pilus assembly protein PilW
MKTQKGLSIIELMVAIAIGAMLLAGAVSLLVNNKRIYRNQNEMGRIQENARFAIERLVSDIRTSGYIGCSHDPLATYSTVAESDGSSTASKAGGANDDFSGRQAWSPTENKDQISTRRKDIEGSESGGNWFPSNTANIYTTYGDSITVRYYKGQQITIVDPSMTSKSDPIYIDMPVGFTFSENDVVSISNCKGGDIFKISAPRPFDSDSNGVDDQLRLTHALVNSGGTTVNTSTELSQQYLTTDNAKINSLVARRYFVGDGTKGRALFVASSDTLGEEQELVEGVEDMQIFYGVDNDSDSELDGYYTATAVNALAVTPTTIPATDPWDRVLSVRIQLTLVSDEENNLSPEARTISTTVKLRNRS